MATFKPPPKLGFTRRCSLAQLSKSTSSQQLGKIFARNRSYSATEATMREDISRINNIIQSRKENTKPVYYIYATLPDGSKRTLVGEDGMKVADVVWDVVMEYNLTSYKIHLGSCKSPVLLDAKAALLQNANISIDDGDLNNSQDDIIHEQDKRLRLVSQLLRSETIYKASLASIFEVYAEPLRKFSSLSKEDHKVFFFGLEPLLSLSSMLSAKLAEVIQTWDPGTSTVGNFFSKQFWHHYDEYYIQYGAIKQLFCQKRDGNKEFAEFCRLRKGSARPSLQYLLRLPIQRIPNYEKYLDDLLSVTDPSHPDYDELSKASSQLKTMVTDREEEHVRDRVYSATKRKSGGSVIFRSLNKKHLNSSPGTQSGKSNSFFPDTIDGDKSSKDFRTYLLEGPVQFNTGVQTQDRYLFLFNDLLLVAKPKSSTTFKLKQRIRVREMWTATCLEEVAEATRQSPETSFVIGWPTTNVVASFNNAELKSIWYNKLIEQINLEKSREPKETIVKISNKEVESGAATKCILVSNDEEAQDVVKRCMKEFQISDSEPKDYKLWVRSKKEDMPYPLIGHEHVYSIKMSHWRDDTQLNEQELSLDEKQIAQKGIYLKDETCEFVLRKAKKAPKINLDESGNKRAKKLKMSPFGSLFKKRDQNKVDPSLQPIPKLFGRTLQDTSVDGIPDPIRKMMTVLRSKGPNTAGIFRKSASQRQFMDVRERLDAGEEVNADQIPVFVVAALLKDFLRSMPDCLLVSDNYHAYMETIALSDFKERVYALQQLLRKLPDVNICLLRHLMCVFYHIKEKSNDNSMDARNLAVCSGHSLLWPPRSGDPNVEAHALHNVPDFITFLIEHTLTILGDDIPGLLKDEQPVGIKHRQDSSTDSDSMHSMPNLQEHRGRRDDSSLDSLDRDFYGSVDSSPGLPKSQISPASLDSGLPLSDTQLDDEEVVCPETRVAHGSTNQSVVGRSLSQYEETNADPDPGRLSSSCHGTLETSCSEVPVPPPRRHRRRPVSDQPKPYSDNLPRASASLRHSVSAQGELSGQNRPGHSTGIRIPRPLLGHLLEGCEMENGGEMESNDIEQLRRKHHDIGVLQRSESGAKLYFTEDHYSNADRAHLNQSACIPPANYDTGNSLSVGDLSPSRHAWNSRSPASHPRVSYPAQPADKCFGAHGSPLPRPRFSVSPQISPEMETPPENSVFNLEFNESSSQKPTTSNVVVMATEANESNACAPPQKNSELTCSSVDRSTPKQNVSMRREAYKNGKTVSSRGQESLARKELNTTSHVSKTGRSHSLPPTQVPLIGPSHLQEKKMYRAGMTNKGSDVFPARIISTFFHQSLPEEKVRNDAVNSRIAQTVSSQKSNESSKVRSESKEKVLKRQPRIVEKSATDSAIGQASSRDNGASINFTRPEKPPTYQQAIHRNSLMQENVPLANISEQDIIKTKVNSARAKQLYAESIEKYREEQNNVRRSTSPAAESEPDDLSKVELTAKNKKLLRCKDSSNSSKRRPESWDERSKSLVVESPSGGDRRSLSQNKENSTRHRQSRDVSDERKLPSYEKACQRAKHFRGQRERHVLATQCRDMSPPAYVRDDKPSKKVETNSQMDESRSRRSVEKKGETDNKMDITDLCENVAEPLHNNSADKTSRNSSDSSSRNLNRSRSDSSDYILRRRRGKLANVPCSSSSSDDEAPSRREERKSRNSSRSSSGASDNLHTSGSGPTVARMKRLSKEDTRYRRRTVGGILSVKDRDWHRDLAEQYNPSHHILPIENTPRYSYITSSTPQLDTEESSTTRRWSRPVHPSKDLVVTYTKDSKTNSKSKPNSTHKPHTYNRSQSTPINPKPERTIVIVEKPKSKSQESVATTENSRLVEDMVTSEDDQSAAINWSVSKLRGIYDIQKEKAKTSDSQPSQGSYIRSNPHIQRDSEAGEKSAERKGYKTYV